MTDDQWNALITLGAGKRPQPIKMFTYRNKYWPSWSRPVVLAAEDGTEYVVKSPKVGSDRARAVVTEQIVAFVGTAMGAPVGHVGTVEITQPLIDLHKVELEHLEVGICHASKRIPRTSERAWIDHVDLAENRSRFALLAVLYGWALAQDHQLIYDQIVPYHVHSVDHGFFFVNGPNWTAASLQTGMTTAALDASLVIACKPTDDELRPAVAALRAITDATIADAVARPPDSWGFSESERLQVARYLAARRETLVALFP